MTPAEKCLQIARDLNESGRTAEWHYSEILKGIEAGLTGDPNGLPRLDWIDDLIHAAAIAATPDGEVDAVFVAWNEMAEKIGLPKAQRLTTQRTAAIRKRLQDSWWRSHWTKALEMVPKCAHLTGKSDANWKATLDFFLRPSSVLKIIEGAYPKGVDEQEEKEKEAATRKRLEEMLERRKRSGS